jgi:hypothetical protein
LPVPLLALQIEVHDTLVEKRAPIRHLILGGMNQGHQGEEDGPAGQAQEITSAAVGEVTEETIYTFLTLPLPLVPQVVPAVDEGHDLLPGEGEEEVEPKGGTGLIP